MRGAEPPRWGAFGSRRTRKHTKATKSTSARGAFLSRGGRNGRGDPWVAPTSKPAPAGLRAFSPALQRRATRNRESTRMDANPPLARRFRAPAPAFGFPLSASGEGERGGEVGMPAGLCPFSPALQRRATRNRESTRRNANLPQPAGLRTSPPAFGFPLSASGEGERGGEVGMPAGLCPSSPMLQRRAGGRAGLNPRAEGAKPLRGSESRLHAVRASAATASCGNSRRMK